MLRAVGPLGPMRLVLVLMRRFWPDLLAALLLAAVSVRLGSGLSRTLTPDLVLPLLGIVASVLIGFRASQAYSRWWEARTLWGSLRNISRAWGAALLALSPAGQLSAPMQRMLERQVLLVWTLTEELRPQVAAPPPSQLGLRQLRAIFPDETSSQSLLDGQARSVAACFEAGVVEPTARVLLVEMLRDSLQAIGGLERIRAQPFPASLALLSRLLVWLFAWLMFLRLEADALTPAAGNAVAFVLMVGYVLAERLASAFDRPLEDSLLGLPQHHICSSITRGLLGSSHPLAVLPQPLSATVWT